jgi:hypothetical protein
LSGTTAAVTNTTQAVGGFTVTVTAVNAAGSPQGGIDDRDRAAPTTAPTLNQIYDDFIFTAGGVGDGGGVDLAIVSGGALAPNTAYLFSVYSYDNDSSTQTQPRTSAWFDGNNADVPVLTTLFTGGVSPLTDDQYKFTGVALTDGSGNLFLKARSTTARDTSNVITPGLFINGFEINEVPEPSAMAMIAALLTIGLLSRSKRRNMT